MKNTDICADFAEVLRTEQQAIADLRTEFKTAPSIGLAFSGGGIRSATLNLGILQGFAKQDILPRFDYLSTVSGGGYIGAWFSSLVQRNSGMQQVQTELKQSTLPDPPANATTHAIQWLRSYSNYLTPKTGLFTADTLTALAQWFTNTLINQLLLFAMLIVVMMSTIYLSHSVLCQTATTSVRFHPDAWWLVLQDNLATLQGALGAGLIVLSLIGSLWLCSGQWRKKAFNWLPVALFLFGAGGLTLFFWHISIAHVRDAFEIIQSRPAVFVPNAMIGLGVPAASLLIALGMIASIALLGNTASQGRLEWWHRIGGMNIAFVTGWLVLFVFSVYLPHWINLQMTQSSPAFQSLGGMLVWLASFATAKLGQSTLVSTSKPDAMIRTFAKILPYVIVTFLLLASGYLSYRCFLSPNPQWIFIGLLLFVVIGNFLFNINLFSLHHFYRNRLTRCYLGATNRHRQADTYTGFDAADDLYLASLKQRPLPIVNAALNITDGSQLAWQQRKAAAFSFSPYYCGFKLPAGETWCRTEQYTGNQGPQLGSLIATSGAAASPNMGYHTNPVMGLLMTIFNARLGRWFGNPLHNNYFNRLMEKLYCPLRIGNPYGRNSPTWNAYYLIKELFTRTDTHSGYLYLSDGGHFENLGIYELVRRRCKLIVAVDAGADGDYQFEDLGNAIRKCKVDFGVSIQIDLEALLPATATQYGLFKCSQSHFAIGTIDYQGDGSSENNGYLVYIKSSLTGREPTDLINFKLQEPAFPHHATVDQFFNESQFESYRRLGEHIADLTLKQLQQTAAINRLLWPQLTQGR